jgi:ABC-type multidrug transport system ATPase subunit
MSVSTTSKEICRASGLVVARGHRRIVLPDFSISEGERLAVLGANGSGKSTLGLVVAGLIPVRSGQLWRKPELSIGYLPQAGGLYPHLTVRANIAFFRRIFVSDKRFDPRLFPVLWTLGLETLLEVRVRELSGGQFRLAAIACTLCLGADALVLDEPLSGLDDKHRRAVGTAIEELDAEVQFIVATGHRAEDVNFCDRTLVIGGAE